MRRFFTLMLALAISCLTACDESRYDPTPIPPPTSIPSSDAGALLDMTDEQTPAPTPTPVPEPDLKLPDEWPAAYLPENFPVFTHSAIENVRRENGEIVMLVTEDPDDIYIQDEKNTLTGSFASLEKFRLEIHDHGYADYPLPLRTSPGPYRDCFFNQEGTVCELLDAGRGPDGEFKWKITVKFHQTYDFNISPYFIDWPPLDTDLGLEEIVFDEWPTEYLPEGFPQPIGIEPVSMAQLKNGVFITFIGETGDYDYQIWDTGYKQYRGEGLGHFNYYKNPYFNHNKDRYYYIHSQAEINAISASIKGFTEGTAAENNAAGRKTVIQVIKGEDTERYWQNKNKG